MADRMTKELVINAILVILTRHKLAQDCIFHSDRGSQYTSKAIVGMLQQYGLRQGFSRVGMPGDNAWSESFFATMKKELIHWTHFETKELYGRQCLSIYCFYNVKRIQKRIDYMSPREYRRSFRKERLAKVA